MTARGALDRAWGLGDPMTEDTKLAVALSPILLLFFGFLALEVVKNEVLLTLAASQ